MKAQLLAVLLMCGSAISHAQCKVTYSDMAKLVKMNKVNFELEAKNVGYSYDKEDPFNREGRRVYKCASSKNQMDRVGGDVNLKTIDYKTANEEEMLAFVEDLRKAGFQEMNGTIYGMHIYFHKYFEARWSVTETSDKKVLYILQLSEL